MSKTYSTLHRLKWPFIFVITAIIITALLQTTPQKHLAQNQSQQKEVPDYYLEKATVIQMSTDGKPARKITVDELLHHPKRKHNALLKPKLTAIEGNVEWRIEADHGTATTDNEHITLWGNVKIYQSTNNKSSLTITTERLEYWQKKEYAETQSPVTIRQQGHVIQAKGMQAHLKNKTIKLLSEVRGKHAPRQQ